MVLVLTVENNQLIYMFSSIKKWDELEMTKENHISAVSVLVASFVLRAKLKHMRSSMRLDMYWVCARIPNIVMEPIVEIVDA
jgi:hypothetical protein